MDAAESSEPRGHWSNSGKAVSIRRASQETGLFALGLPFFLCGRLFFSDSRMIRLWAVDSANRRLS